MVGDLLVQGLIADAYPNPDPRSAFPSPKTIVKSPLVTTDCRHAKGSRTLRLVAAMLGLGHVGIPSDVIESLLLYFWFRCTTNRYGLPEAFFQKVERHWDEAIDQVSRYMDDQAAADRRQV